MSFNPGGEGDAGGPGGPTQAPMPGAYTGPTQPSYPPEKPRGRSRIAYIRIGIVVLVAIAVGVGFLLRDRLSGGAASLQPGECFDQPVAGTTLVTDVQRQPCNEAHDAEVVVNVSHTAAPAASYPPASEFADLAGDECVSVIQSYTGLTVPELIARNLDFAYFYPTPDGWASGDRVVTCYVTSSNGSKLTSSVRSTGARPTP